MHDDTPMKEREAQKPSKLSMLDTYLGHLDGLKRSLSRLLSNPQDVEDVVQEAYIRAHLAERSSQIQQPKSYLFKIARNVALNQLRQTTRRPTDYLEEQPSTTVLMQNSSLEDEVMAQEKFEVLCAGIATLPPQCRKIYLMRKVYAMPCKDIAATLELSIKTVEMHIQKGQLRCSLYLDKHLGDEPALKVQGAQGRAANKRSHSNG